MWKVDPAYFNDRSPGATDSFSPTEEKLFKELGFKDLMATDYFRGNPIGLYRLVIEKCFLDRRDDKFTDALRAVMLLFNAGNFYRMTLEWDQLICDRINS